MKNAVMIFIILVISAQYLSAFSSASIQKNTAVSIQDHFVFLNVHLILNKKTPDNCNKDKNCELTSNIDHNVVNINTEFINTPMLAASGFVFKHEKNKTYVLTSMHVCEGIKSYLSFKDILEQSKSEMLESLSRQTKYKELDQVHVQSNYNLNAVATLFDFNGNQYQDVSIKKQDKSKDLCVIESNNTIGTPVVVSNKNCMYGEEVVNVSASNGNYFPRAVPYYVGVYSGSVKSKEFGLMGLGEEIAIYTLDIKQGSSGSAVFSKKTKKLCGNVNAIMQKSKLAIGITTMGIKEFIER